MSLTQIDRNHHPEGSAIAWERRLNQSHEVTGHDVSVMLFDFFPVAVVASNILDGTVTCHVLKISQGKCGCDVYVRSSVFFSSVFALMTWWALQCLA